MNGSTHPRPLYISTSCLGGSLKQDYALAVQWVCHCSALWLVHPEMLYIGCAFRTTPDAQSRKTELLNTFLLQDTFHFPERLMIFWGRGYLLVVFHRVCCVIGQVLIQTQFIFMFQDHCLALSKKLRVQTSALNLDSRRHSEHCD